MALLGPLNNLSLGYLTWQLGPAFEVLHARTHTGVSISGHVYSFHCRGRGRLERSLCVRMMMDGDVVMHEKFDKLMQ
jgi:hypothetical protein